MDTSSTEQVFKPIRLRKQKRIIFDDAEDQTFVKTRIESHRSAVLSCEFNKTGEYLLSSNSRGEIHICDLEGTSEKLAYLKGHQQSVTEVHYSTDGVYVISASMDGTVGLWDANRGVQTSSIIAHGESVNTVQCTETGWPMICSGSSDKTVRIWDPRQRRCAAKFETDHGVSAACFSQCGIYVFSAGLGGDGITVWDVRYHQKINKISGHSGPITGLSVSPCGKMLASCSSDNTIRRYNINIPLWTKKDNLFIPLEQDSPNHLVRCAWSPDGNIITAGTSGKKLLLFNASNGEPLCSLDGHDGIITDVAFHPIRKIVMSASTDNRIVLQKL